MFLIDEVRELYDNFSNKVYEERFLDKKTKELIAVSCSVMADCVPCLSWHYKQAVKAGATKEEISEALAISMTLASGSKKAKYSEVINNLEKE